MESNGLGIANGYGNGFGYEPAAEADPVAASGSGNPTFLQSMPFSIMPSPIREVHPAEGLFPVCDAR